MRVAGMATTKLLGGVVLSIFLAGPTIAADMRAPVKAPPRAAAVAVYSWTGCYIGGHGGGGWAEHTQTRIESRPGVLSPANYGTDVDSSGAVAGGQVGCDWQSGNFVFGVQFMGSWTGIDSSYALPSFPTFRADFDVKSLLSVTGRVGYTVTPAALLYVKGGGIWKREHFDIFQPSGALSESATKTFTGWTFGGGLEYGFTPWVSAFVEGMYSDFGTERFSYTTAPGAVGGPERVDHKQRVATVVGGLNFRWNWASPVVARY